MVGCLVVWLFALFVCLVGLFLVGLLFGWLVKDAIIYFYHCYHL